MQKSPCHRTPVYPVSLEWSRWLVKWSVRPAVGCDTILAGWQGARKQSYFQVWDLKLPRPTHRIPENQGSYRHGARHYHTKSTWNWSIWACHYLTLGSHPALKTHSFLLSVEREGPGKWSFLFGSLWRMTLSSDGILGWHWHSHT